MPKLAKTLQACRTSYRPRVRSSARAFSRVVATSAITLDIAAASVTVTATIAVADTPAAQAMQASVASSSGVLSSQANLQSAFTAAGLTGVTVTSAPSVGWCCNPTGASGDPHITLAHGGKADFRGSHNEFYVFLSSPGYQFSPWFQEIDFVYARPATGLKQLVHGSFMTKAIWFIVSGGEEHFLHMDAMNKGAMVVIANSPNFRKLGTWSKLSLGDDLKIETRELTISVATSAWTVNVTSKPIYGLVAPYTDNTYESYHGRWQPFQRRLDIAIKGDFPQPDAHGIIGQSYQDEEKRHGRLDEYLIERDDAGLFATADGQLPPMTTSAQAEGAIEGVYTDYKLGADKNTEQLGHLSSVWTYAFKYSRYRYPKRAKGTIVLQRVAFTNERVGGQGETVW